jgi:flagellar motor protein MotB
MGEDQQRAAQQDEPQDRWGDAISDARKAELQAILDAWNAPDADHGNRKGPFDQVALSGADVFWLANQVRKGGDDVPDLHSERASPFEAHLEGADLERAHLETLYVNTPSAWRGLEAATWPQVH